MSRSRNNRFSIGDKRLSAEFGALSLAICGALIVTVFDLGTSAGAAQAENVVSTISAAQAVEMAGAQGAVGADILSPTPVYSAEYDAAVWTVRGDDIAVVDAESGDLLEIQFGR